MSINKQQAIHLQGIGLFCAKPASELQIGDTMVWNYGYTSVAVAIRQQGKSVYITERAEDGKQYDRRFLGSRLVAVSK